jgi:hypothetical protein
MSESHSDSNRCTPCKGETRYTWHVRFLRQSTYATHTFSVGSSYTWQPFASHQQCWTDPTAPKKKAPDTIPSMPANWSIGPPPSSSPKTIIEAVIKAKHMLTTCYIGLLGSQHQYGSVRSILAHGVNPSILNRHRRGLQPWRCRLTTSHSRTFPIDDPPLSS